MAQGTLIIGHRDFREVHLICRCSFNTGMNERAAISYREQQTLEASIVLRGLLADGGIDHEQTLRRYAPSFIQTLPVEAGF